MQSHHRRHRTPALNLVALMDIFTILVFFLLVNSSNIQPPGTIALPQSVAEKAPEETLVITVTDADILVQGRRVAEVAGVLASAENTIPGLAEELRYQRERRRNGGQAEGADEPQPVTIMGDRAIPFRLLKRILVTCSAADFPQVALAVVRKAAGG
jgi:biopolymer transport protein ExbD